MRLTVTTLLLLLSPALISAGPGAYAVCQTGCNAAFVSCCAAAGVTAGVFMVGVGTPLAALACSATQGACMSACAALALAPTP